MPRDTGSSGFESLDDMLDEEIPLTSDLGLRRMMRVFSDVFRRQDERRRETRLLEAASRLFPYISADFTDRPLPMTAGGALTENEQGRAARAVEIALLMEQWIKKDTEQ